ncbi:MAG: cation diffusion facilitator family transporter [Polyangiaceae bacterium]
MSETREKHEGEGIGHIIQSLGINLLIALVKAVAAFFTKSGAMLAEALHSFSDCGNQALLLLGVKQARKPPDASHPFGYGRALYFWSFLVALMLFVGGGVFSIYEGIHKILEPERVEKVWLGFLILGISFALEGAATLSNIKEINKRKGRRAFFQYLRETKDSDLVVVFGENAAAVLGLVLAMIALGLAALTGDGRFDGGGSIAIGVVLILVAGFLAYEVKSLLLGEAADETIDESARALAKEVPLFERVIHLRTTQQGAGEVLVAIKVAVSPNAVMKDVAIAIDDFEKALRTAHPDVRWCFVEPDVYRESA